jgi:nucleotide-binding universal stress UspA family protein
MVVPRRPSDSVTTQATKGTRVQGTLICGVTDTDDGRAALELALELRERLALRLVLVHVADGIGAANGTAEDGYESVSMRNDRVGAARLLARLADEYRIGDTAERREAVGDPAAMLGQIAAEEAGDLIVLGSRVRGRFRRGLESRLAEELEATTTVPVVIAPPRDRVQRAVATSAARR